MDANNGTENPGAFITPSVSLTLCLRGESFLSFASIRVHSCPFAVYFSQESNWNRKIATATRPGGLYCGNQYTLFLALLEPGSQEVSESIIVGLSAVGLACSCT